MTARADGVQAVAALARPGRYRLQWTLQQGTQPERHVGPAREITVADAPTTMLDGGVRAADLEAARRR